MKYFKISEFECKCGCGKNNMDHETLIMLDAAREYAKTSFVINSGCRCEDHNKKVGGSPTSSHLKGLAVDIRADNSVKRYKVVKGLLKAGFTRIGIGSNFVHADNDKKKDQEIIWTY